MPRIAIAIVVFLIGFTLYVGAAVTLADLIAPLHWSVQALYFLAAGVLWVWPTKWLMFWAARKH
ncbi:MAG: DUF2842 domain-containing protein [Proteobacteria bacterium]|nr:DUF2842 domain-containing protein [Pseudomonadota bacterium]